jgi:hypothetical protein
MYDVIYIDAHGSETPLAQHVDDRKEATDVARQMGLEPVLEMDGGFAAWTEAGFPGGFKTTLKVIPTFPTMVAGAQVGAAPFRAPCRPEVLGGVSPNTQKRYRAVRDKHVQFCQRQGIRTWAEVDDHPDGICLDAEGAVWYGDVGNRRCVRVREGGEILQVVDLDRGCFACVLGGPDRRTLFMVTNEWGEEATSDAAGQVLQLPAPAPGAGWP